MTLSFLIALRHCLRARETCSGTMSAEPKWTDAIARVTSHELNHVYANSLAAVELQLCCHPLLQDARMTSMQFVIVKYSLFDVLDQNHSDQHNASQMTQVNVGFHKNDVNHLYFQIVCFTISNRKGVYVNMTWSQRCLVRFRAAVICGFFTNEMLRQQTSEDNDESLINTAVTNLDHIDDFRVEIIDVR